MYDCVYTCTYVMYIVYTCTAFTPFKPCTFHNMQEVHEHVCVYIQHGHACEGNVYVYACIYLYYSSLSGEWLMVDEGVGYNQYNLFLPHARYKHAGVPLSETKFVFFGGCARYTLIHATVLCKS